MKTIRVLFLALVAVASYRIDLDDYDVIPPAVDPYEQAQRESEERMRSQQLDWNTFDDKGNWTWADPHKEDTWERQMILLGWDKKEPPGATIQPGGSAVVGELR